MNNHRSLCLLCVLVLGLSVLTGCTDTSSHLAPSSPTLPPQETLYEAPTGDNGLTHQETFALYLPSTDGSRLLCEWETLDVVDGVHPADTVVRTLLRHPGSKSTRPLSEAGSVYLSGAHPVVVSGDVCTVNLASAALLLSREELYTVALSLSTTLCALEDISYVSVLIADQAVAMDISGYLPMGLQTAHTGEQLAPLWERLENRKAELGSDPADTPISTTAALYFPVEGGVMAEARNLQSPGQTPVQLA